MVPQLALKARRWSPADPVLGRVRAARRRYWAARAAGDRDEIETALREWVEAQLAAADRELDGRELLEDVQ
jgi:hypothetical protein